VQLKDCLIPVYGDIKFRGECPKEELEQVTFFNRVRREYPESYGRLALHPRNEQQLRAGQHVALAKQKAEGMTPGASDIVIPGSPTFVCEMKRRDHTLSAWQPGQMQYLLAAQANGAFVCVALGHKSAWDALLIWSGQ